MAVHVVNDRAVEKARRLIESRQYVLNSDWGEVQPNAAAENAFLESRLLCLRKPPLKRRPRQDHPTSR